MTDQQVQLFLADLAIIILLARLLGMAARRLGQPPVLGEIIAAAEPDTIVLGPDRTFPETLVADGAAQLVTIARSLPEAPSAVAARRTRGEGEPPLSWSLRNWLSRTG